MMRGRLENEEKNSFRAFYIRKGMYEHVAFLLVVEYLLCIVTQ
jgi:hypothetical protein